MDEYAGKVNLPYILGTTDKISHILRKNNIRTTFEPMSTISKCLKSVQDPIDPKCHKGVYFVPCSCGKTYIGETGRSILTRIQEHAADIKHNCSKTLALAEHSSKTNHHRKFKEAVEIGKHPNNLNRDKGWKISDNWIPTLSPDPISS